MNAAKLNNYKVISVQSTSPPDGFSEGTWHRYIIGCGNSIMEGKSQGSLKQVTEHANELVEKINTRNTWGQRKTR